MPKHRMLSQKLTLLMPQDFSKLGYFLPKGSTFGSAYDVLASSLSPSRRKISKFAEILGHQKGQLLAQRTMFWHLHYHPLGKKYPNLLKSWGIKRVNFWLSVRCFGIFTITLLAKKSK